jgi:hypothetical protein
MTPTLSVVVPSVNGWDDLEGCLRALRADAQDFLPETLQIIVVERTGETVRRHVAAEFPETVMTAVERSETIPEMRARAIASASAPMVAVIEDHILVPVGWARAIVEAQRAHGGVVGGSLYNAATTDIVDWAAFFCEYSQVLPPLAAGPAERLNGNNTVYPQVELRRHRGAVESGRWEDYLHRELRAAGVSLTSRPDIKVAHTKHYTAVEYMAQRFLYGRAFAGDRVAGRAWPVRIAYTMAGAAVPAIVGARTIRNSWQSPAHRTTLIRALPLIACFVCVGGLGEAVGAAFGPGDALARVC